MDELELLKKDWKKNDGQFKQVSEKNLSKKKISDKSVYWQLKKLPKKSGRP